MNSTFRIEHNMLIHPTSKIGAWVLLCHPALLSFSFLVILWQEPVTLKTCTCEMDELLSMTRKLWAKESTTDKAINDKRSTLPLRQISSHHLHRHLVSPILTAPRGAGKQRQWGQQKTQRTFPAHTRQQCQNNSARSLNAHMKRKTSKMNSLPCCYWSTQLAYTPLHRPALHGQPPKSKRSDDPQYLLRDAARNGHIF